MQFMPLQSTKQKGVYDVGRMRTSSAAVAELKKVDPLTPVNRRTMTFDMMRPRQIIERLNADGIGGLTEYSLYKLLNTGIIPARKPGRSYIVSYQNVLEYLQCADGTGDIVPPPGGIGRIERCGLNRTSP